MSDIDALIGSQIGTFDVACPLCGPSRRSPVNRRRQTLRIFRRGRGFAGFYCARCGEKGACRDHAAQPPDLNKLKRAKAEAAEREHQTAQERLRTARSLWSRSVPITGTIAESYLRSCRGYGGPLPTTLRFLPARGGHPPAMIAAFALPTEFEPHQLAGADADVVGVHVTRLAVDGSSKAGTDTDKFMIGKSVGLPIVLAPPNDLLGLAITEGIEDALTTHEASGLGAWAAGAASRLPALAKSIPDFIEAVTIMTDDDVDGRRHAAALRAAIAADHPTIEVRCKLLIDGSNET
jgi:Toprim domain